MRFFTGSPASDWTRNLRFDYYVQLLWLYNFNRNIIMVLIMLYEIYSIKHYFFRIMSQHRQATTTFIANTFHPSAPCICQSIGNRKINRISGDNCMCRPSVSFMVLKTEGRRTKGDICNIYIYIYIYIYIKIVILKLSNNSQVLHKRQYSELQSLMSLSPIFNDIAFRLPKVI